MAGPFPFCETFFIFMITLLFLLLVFASVFLLLVFAPGFHP